MADRARAIGFIRPGLSLGPRRRESRLPEQTMHLIGREHAVVELCDLLNDPRCRLLTLTGPGGIGKTSLAIEVAARLDRFADGVYFVALQPVQGVDFIFPAIADAAGIPLAGHDPVSIQLLNNLSNKQQLLILDNFEHLLAGAPLLLDLLQAAPAVKLLVTSRETVGVREEWLYPLDGLSVPTSEMEPDPATHAAVQLFVERARQVRHAFKLDDEYEAVSDICRQVEGNPLAIELAASWLTVLNCPAIAAQLRQSFDILTSTLRNIPERHRSMRAALYQSWSLLGEQDRDVFCKLTLFRGLFTYQAAQAVAGASLPVLAALVSKSLLRHSADGRYQIHELLRQYGAEKLAELSAAEVAAHEAYSAYFMNFLAERRFEFDGRGQFQALQDIAQELENIRKAWQWSVEHLQAEALRGALRSLCDFYQHRSRYVEGTETFAGVASHFDKSELDSTRGAVLAESLTYFGWFCIRTGRLAEAKEALLRAQQVYLMLDMTPPQYRAGDPITALLILALVQGDYEQALSLGETARRQAEQHNQRSALALAYYGLANALLAQGEYAQARNHAEQGLALTNAIENRWFSSFLHDVLGQIAVTEEELDVAKRHFEASHTIRAEFEEPGGMALNLRHLGDVAAQRQSWSEARVLYTRSLALYRELGDRGGVAGTERGLGVVAWRGGELDAAKSHFNRALEAAVATEVVPLILLILVEVGEFLLQSSSAGSSAKMLGLRALAFVQGHPSVDRHTYERVTRYLAQSGQAPEASPEPPDSLASLAAALHAQLALPNSTDILMLNAQAVAEPLTAREFEVLRLLATGCSNPEIAAQLVVALGTIKAHTSSLYRKLDVANRTQAVERARTLGLLL
jgi:predicted ATPase/DNA-binding CsgD family transcriptional regulator